METLSGSLECQVRSAARIIRKGGLVAYPTETLYGIGADATNERAVERVFYCKTRSRKKPISIHLPSASSIPEYARVPVGFDPGVFLPGPVTLLLKYRCLTGKKRLSPLCISGDGLVGIRVSSHPAACRLTQLCGVPITATSANVSQAPPPSSHEEIPKNVADFVDAVICAGPTIFAMSSTVFDVTRMRVVREGVLDGKSILTRL